MKHKNRYFAVTLSFAVLFLGSVFIVLPSQFDLSETYRKYFTITFGLIFVVTDAVFPESEINTNGIFKTICLTGLAESVYALAQFFKVIPSYNKYYSYTGSFDNPAVFSMLLAFCVPIAVHYALQHKWGYIMWWMAALFYLVFIGLSESRASLLAAVASVLLILLGNKKIRNVLLNGKVLAVGIPLSLFLLLLIYQFKADSANGRLLIWRISTDMFREKPLLGFGPGGFLAHYMDYQAKYLSSHLDSPFLLLADNVNNPFNEYVLVLINYGIVGMCCLMAFIVVVFKRLLLLDEEKRILLSSCAVVLLVVSLFSYPFSNPFVWVISGIIIMMALFKNTGQRRILIAVPIMVCSVAGIVLSIFSFLPEREWQAISQRSMMGETEAVLPDFRRLHERMDKNGRFLYNFGAELHYSGHFKESLQILEECSSYLNDYDVQMLMADCYKNLGDTLTAIDHYHCASRMVPSKFLPQYQIMNLYLEQGDTINAVNTASAILAKDIKVYRSKTVQRIISEAKSIVQEKKP